MPVAVDAEIRHGCLLLWKRGSLNEIGAHNSESGCGRSPAGQFRGSRDGAAFGLLRFYLVPVYHVFKAKPVGSGLLLIVSPKPSPEGDGAVNPQFAKARVPFTSHRPMSFFTIHGGRPLCGEVEVGGSKNAALPMMAATILADGPVELQRAPRVADVATLAAVERTWHGRRLDRRRTAAGNDRPDADGRAVAIGAADAGELLRPRTAGGPAGHSDRPPARRLQHRRPARRSAPEGTGRPGGRVETGSRLRDRAAKRLRGATVDLSGPRGPTVTGTANILCAAVLARGATQILAAAREPEIVDLGRLSATHGSEDRRPGDFDDRSPRSRVASPGPCIASFPTASKPRRCCSPRRSPAARPRRRGPRRSTYRRSWRDWPSAARKSRPSASACRSACGRPLRAVSIVAEPYPGIPTDLQAQWTALLSLAPGRSTIEDRVFPNRFLHVAELNRMGARIVVGGATATVAGAERLGGARRSWHPTCGPPPLGAGRTGRRRDDHGACNCPFGPRLPMPGRETAAARRRIERAPAGLPGREEFHPTCPSERPIGGDGEQSPSPSGRGPG